MIKGTITIIVRSISDYMFCLVIGILLEPQEIFCVGGRRCRTSKIIKARVVITIIDNTRA